MSIQLEEAVIGKAQRDKGIMIMEIDVSEKMRGIKEVRSMMGI